MGKTSAAVKNRYASKNYDRFQVLVRKGTLDMLKEYCDKHGTSVGGLVKELLERETGIKLTSPSDKE